MRRLRAEECDSSHAARRGSALRLAAEHITGIAVHTARHIDCNAGNFTRVDRVYHIARGALERAREPCAKERIDDKRIIAQDFNTDRCDSTEGPPAPRVDGGIAFKLIS